MFLLLASISSGEIELSTYISATISPRASLLISIFFSVAAISFSSLSRLAWLVLICAWISFFCLVNTSSCACSVDASAPSVAACCWYESASDWSFLTCSSYWSANTFCAKATGILALIKTAAATIDDFATCRLDETGVVDLCFIPLA